MRDRRAGGYDFCKPAGANFIPRGEAPRDEMAPKGLQKSYASQSAITQLYCYRVLLNKKLTEIVLQCHNLPSIWRNFCNFWKKFVKWHIKWVCKTFALPRESAKPIASRSKIGLTGKKGLQYFCSLGFAKLLQPLGSKSITVIDFTEKCRLAIEISF